MSEAKSLQDSVNDLFAQKEDAEFHINRIQKEFCGHPIEVVAKEPRANELDTGKTEYTYFCKCGCCRLTWIEKQ